MHQGGASAPLKLQRAFTQASGHCELPLLHTAGGLVGGDQLQLELAAEPHSRALITTVAAQKAYGSVGRSRLSPGGQWSRQQVQIRLERGSALEWLPQELVLYNGALYEQSVELQLAGDASFVGAEVVRFGRTAAGEGLGAGRWRSSLQICRQQGPQQRWELVDRLELGGDALTSPHGLAAEPVFGSLVWAAPAPLPPEGLAQLLDQCRNARSGLDGAMACGPLNQGLIARYRGDSTQAARFWFCRIWRLLRLAMDQAPPQLPRVWPFQEDPWAAQEFSMNAANAAPAATV